MAESAQVPSPDQAGGSHQSPGPESQIPKLPTPDSEGMRDSARLLSELERTSSRLQPPKIKTENTADRTSLEEYLSRLRANESRIHRYLLRHVSEVRAIVEAAATAVRRGGTLWVMGEGELDAVARVLVTGFFSHGEVGLRAHVFEDPLAEAMAVIATGASPPEALPGDLLLAFCLSGSDEFRARIERARGLGLFIAVVRSKTLDPVEQGDDIGLALPVAGFRWLCSAALTVGRVINRVARGILSQHSRSGKFVEVACPGCAESVLVEEEFVGRRGLCPFCRALFEIPRSQADGRGGSRRLVIGDEALAGGERRIATRFRPSDCSVSLQVGEPPDAGATGRPLVELEADGLEFAAAAGDSILHELGDGAVVWLRLEIPAFLEPIITQGTVVRREAATSQGAVRVEVQFSDPDGAVRAKLERLAMARGF